MSLPPLSSGEDKLTDAVSLNLAGTVQVQICDRSIMGRNGRMELLSD